MQGASCAEPLCLPASQAWVASAKQRARRLHQSSCPTASTYLLVRAQRRRKRCRLDAPQPAPRGSVQGGQVAGEARRRAQQGLLSQQRWALHPLLLFMPIQLAAAGQAHLA